METRLPSTPVRIFLLLFFLTYFQNYSRAAVNTYGFSSTTGVAMEDSTTGIVTTLIATGQDNTASAVTNIGFSFFLNGTSYTQFSVNSNGLMKLGSVAVSTAAVNSIASATDLPKIAAYWDDLKTVGGTVKSRLIGTAPNRKLMVQWTVTVVNNNAASQKFQVWLFETTNTIQFVYGTALPTDPGQYSVGISTSASDYLCVSTATGTASTSSPVDNNTAAISAGTSYRFTTPPGCATLVAPTAGATNLPLENTLSWSAGTGTTTAYDVYFGTSPSPSRVSYNQAATTYNTGILNFNTTYYWKVIARNDSAQALSCVTNQFTTGSPLNYDVTRSTGISYTSISGTGNSVTSGWRNGNSTDDNLSNAIPIGFNFVYNGVTYSNFLVSTNGFITFNTSTAAVGNGLQYGYLNSALSTGTAPASPQMLAPFYEDMVCQGNANNIAGLNAGIKYLVTGSVGSRVLTVEWIGMENWQTGGPNLNFQVKLYEGSNSFDFVYGVMEGFNGTFNLNYSYSVGYNGTGISSTPQSGEVMNQLVANTRSFGLASTAQLNSIPDCYSMIHMAPGAYTAYVPPASLRPSNDSLSTPILIPVNSTPCVEYCGTYYSSANATKSIGSAACANADDDVWFEFIAVNSTTQIKVFGSGNYDPTVELMTTGLSQIACANTVGSGGTETITATTLTIGTHYRVRVYERGANWNSSFSSGQFSICVSAVPIPPVNDDCANAVNITVTGLPAVFQTGQSTAAASGSTGIPTCSVAGTNPDDDVWYTFTAVNTTEIIAVNSNTGFNAAIQLFSGGCASLNSITCVNTFANGQPESITATNLIRNAVYRFRVFHATVGGGTGSYTVSVSSPPPGCTSTMLPPDQEIDMQASNVPFEWDVVPGADNYKIYLDTVNPPTNLLTQTIDTFATASLLAMGKTYYWQLQAGNATGYNTSCPVFSFTTEARPYAFVVRVFLQDLYTSNSNMIPYVNPSDTIADTITVDFVDLDTSINFSETALLSTHGYATVYLPERALNLDFFLTIRHRNSLETWGKQFYLDSLDTTYDFTASDTAAFGNNMIQVSPGVYAIYYGDLNHDGFVDENDLTAMNPGITSLQTGYALGDINGDRIVETVDLSMLENQANLSLSVKNPFSP